MSKEYKIETEREYAYSYFKMSILVEILFIVLLVIIKDDMYTEPSSVLKKIVLFSQYVMIFTSPILIMQIYWFVIGVPFCLKRKKAIRYGEKYNGKIFSINYWNSGKLLIERSTYFFDIKIEYYVNNERKVLNTGRYIGVPTDFIPANDECIVYEYKGKAYVQDFPYIENNVKPSIFETSIEKYLSEGKLRLVNREKQIQAMVEPEVSFRNKNYNVDISEKHYTKDEDLFKYKNEDIPNLNDEDFKLAIAERECMPPKYSNSHILTPALFIRNDNRIAYVFVELEIISYIPYGYEEMNYFVGLCKYLKYNQEMYFQGQEKEFVEGIKNEVKKRCRHLAIESNYFKIKDVLVSIREISKEEFFND